MPPPLKSKDCSILIPSCDAYSDLWKPFFSLFWRYWPDCSFEVFLGSNELIFGDPRIKTIPVGTDRNWTNSVVHQLNAIDTPYVLVCLEDFFFRETIQNVRVLEALQSLKKLNGHVMRLTPRPGPNLRVEGMKDVGILELGAPYRVSTQAAIWNRQSLLNLMRAGESIWEFESLGSERAESYSEGFYGVWDPVLKYGHHVVERGKWFRSEAKRFGRMNIGCDFSSRNTMSIKESLRWNFYKTRSLALDFLPWRSRKQLVSMARRILG